MPSISAVALQPQGLPDHLGRPLPANDSFPRLEPPAAGYRKSGPREEAEALFWRPRRSAPEARTRSSAPPREYPNALREQWEPRERRINLPPLAKPSSQFVTQFIAQQVLPHDGRGDAGFASDGALAYTAARARTEKHFGPVIPVEIRA